MTGLSIAGAATPPQVAAKNKFFRPHSAVIPKSQPHANSTPVIVNAASFLAGISPGGLVTIFGQNLTSVSGVVTAGTNPLPLTLANVSVYVSGIPAPIFSIAYANGQDQISFQVPYSAPTGPNAAEIQVTDSGVLTADFTTDSFTEDPGIFTYNNGDAIAQHGSDGTLVGESNPAVPGEVLVLYVTGLGPLSLNLQDGYGAPSNPLAYTVDPFQVLVDNESAQVLFSGLGPGFVGLYQVNFVVPNDVPAGDLTLQIQSPYASSGVVTLPVR